MKKYLILSALCIVCGMIALFFQGCTTQDGSLADIKRQQQQKFTETHQKCLMRWRGRQWPNVIKYSVHPCQEMMEGCYIERNLKDCNELAELGVL